MSDKDQNEFELPSLFDDDDDAFVVDDFVPFPVPTAASVMTSFACGGTGGDVGDNSSDASSDSSSDSSSDAGSDAASDSGESGTA